MGDSIVSQIVEEIRALPDHLQGRVLNYVRTLRTAPEKGVRGSQLLRFAGTIATEDLEEMRQAIEAGCENVYWPRENP